ncbi:MAG: hypothetical protein NXI00_11125 [Cytophagales bacterium]|nr:hypothetical protein [Cytophagales bacterium]
MIAIAIALTGLAAGLSLLIAQGCKYVEDKKNQDIYPPEKL